MQEQKHVNEMVYRPLVRTQVTEQRPLVPSLPAPPTVS